MMKDEILARLTAQLATANFEPLVSPLVNQPWQSPLAPSASQPKVHYVSSAWVFGTFQVRMRLDRKQQVVGLANSLPQAARFADMAHVFFSDLGARKLQPDCFNYSEAQARADIETGPVYLLRAIANHLFPNGVAKKPARGSLRKEVAALTGYVVTLEARVAALEKRLRFMV